MNELYEPMLERDIDAIPRAIQQYRSRHSSEELFRAVSRFALLASSPSQHGKHALLACVAAKEIEAYIGDRFDDLLTECAIYAAQSRLPWSEPPVTDPPQTDAGHPISLDEIRAAIERRDRRRGERWLAARLKQGPIASDFFKIAAGDLSDFGHKLIVAVGVWKLALMHGHAESYEYLRVAIGEWTAYGGETLEQSDDELERVVEQLVAKNGSVESFHRLVLYDAAMEASRLAHGAAQTSSIVLHPSKTELPIYRLARDYAEYLKAFALAARLPSSAQEKVIKTAKYNRDHAPSFEEWSFA